MTGSLQTWIFGSDNIWHARGGRVRYPGYVAFDFGDVFAGTVVPYDPLWESGGAGRYPVGSRIPKAACTPVGTANTPYVIADGAELSGLDIIGSCITTATSSDQFHLSDFYFTPTFTTMPTTDRAMMFGHNLDFGGSLIEWGTIGGPSANVSSWQNCVDGGNYHLKYCALSRGVDGLHMNSIGNGVVEGCVVSHGHYYAWWNDAGGAVRTSNFTDFGGTARVIGEVSDGHSDGMLHSDGSQTAGWTGWVIRGTRISTGTRFNNSNPSNLDPTVSADYALINNYDADPTFMNAAIIANMDGVHAIGMLVEYSLLAEGGATINLPWRAEDNGAGVTIKDTLVVPNAHGFQVYKQTSTGSAAQTVTNVLRTDNGAAVTVTAY